MGIVSGLNLRVKRSENLAVRVAGPDLKLFYSLVLEAFLSQTVLDRFEHLSLSCCYETALKDNSLLALDDQTILFSVEEVRVLVSQVVKVLAEKLGSFFKNPGHLLSCSVN